jgi:hypothetical protein
MMLEIRQQCRNRVGPVMVGPARLVSQPE